VKLFRLKNYIDVQKYRIPLEILFLAKIVFLAFDFKNLNR